MNEAAPTAHGAFDVSEVLPAELVRLSGGWLGQVNRYVRIAAILWAFFTGPLIPAQHRQVFWPVLSSSFAVRIVLLLCYLPSLINMDDASF